MDIYSIATEFQAKCDYRLKTDINFYRRFSSSLSPEDLDQVLFGRLALQARILESAFSKASDTKIMEDIIRMSDKHAEIVLRAFTQDQIRDLVPVTMKGKAVASDLIARGAQNLARLTLD